MTFIEANNMIDDISWFYGGESITTDDIVECREICHKALEKQIPKKTTEREYVPNGTLVYGCCPNCSYLTKNHFKYCAKCGQALDWSDTE